MRAHEPQNKLEIKNGFGKKDTKNGASPRKQVTGIERGSLMFILIAFYLAGNLA